MESEVDVVHFVTNEKNEVDLILVKFDDPTCKKAIRSSPYRLNFNQAVPLKKHEATFSLEANVGHK